MRYTFEVAGKDEMPDIEQVATLAEIDEPIDYECTFIVARNSARKMLGFAGVNLNMPKYPQFEHIVIHPKVKNSKLSVLLMMRMENFLKERNYKEYVSFILNTRNIMQAYAVKWGMKPYHLADDGVWFYKLLNERNAYVRIEKKPAGN